MRKSPMMHHISLGAFFDLDAEYARSLVHASSDAVHILVKQSVKSPPSASAFIATAERLSSAMKRFALRHPECDER